MKIEMRTKMKVYARKLFPHDITHEVSVRTSIVQEYFGGKTTGFRIVGMRSGFDAMVTINSATDPRFGGEFKPLLINEGGADVNDILLIYKRGQDNYALEIVRQADPRYFNLMVLFRDKDRHSFLEADKEYNIIGL